MHALLKNDKEHFEDFILIVKKILSKEDIRNNHLTIGKELSLKLYDFEIDELKKDANITNIDILAGIDYRPEYNFISDKTGEKVKTHHKVFYLENLSIMNTVKTSNFIIEQKGIVVTSDDSQLKKELNDVQKIAYIADKYLKELKTAEEQYELAQQEYKQKRLEYEENLKQYTQEKKDIDSFNEKEKESAKKENRKANLKTFSKERPKAPEKPLKNSPKLPKQLENDYLRFILNALLISYIYDIYNYEDFFVLIPTKKFEGNSFKKEHIVGLKNKEIKEIKRKEFKAILKPYFLKEKENIPLNSKEVVFSSKFLYSPTNNIGRNSQYVDKYSIYSYLHINQKKEEWEELKPEIDTETKEYPILSKLKPNQTASMLAGGIGNFAKEVTFGDEKILIKGATIKFQTQRETIINNQNVIETIESYSQEIGVLNLTRRELQIIK